MTKRALTESDVARLVPARVTLATLTKRLGLPEHEQQAVLSWTGNEEGTTWDEAEVADLVAAWYRDQLRIALEAAE